MFNVTVLKGKDIFKFFISIMLLIFSIIIISRSVKTENKNTKITTNIKNKISSISENNMIFCLEQVLPNIENKNNINDKVLKKENLYEDILKTQIT